MIRVHKKNTYVLRMRNAYKILQQIPENIVPDPIKFDYLRPLDPFDHLNCTTIGQDTVS
jgi:hypothetical protein